MSLFYDCAQPDDRTYGLDAATDAIRRGELVVIPTDTVYGVAADAFSPEGVADLLAAKGRGREMPPPVLVGSWEGLEGLMLGVDSTTRDLIEAFWPGGLTLIVEHAPSLVWDLGDTRGTVAVRMPAHPVALELLKRTGPLAVTSANKHGAPAALTASDAREALGEAVTVYLDGGDAPTGTLASTIIDLTGPVPAVRREGTVTVEQLQEVVDELMVALRRKETDSPAASADADVVPAAQPDEAAEAAQHDEAAEAAQPDEAAEAAQPDEAAEQPAHPERVATQPEPVTPMNAETANRSPDDASG